MPTIITQGAASAKGYGFGASAATAVNYIEDVFSTWLYTGNGSTQTITNGIDLSGKGGLVWNKWRSSVLGSGDNMLWDTSRGANQKLISNTTDANTNQANGVSFDSTGFTMGASGNNNSSALFASWTFRKQAKFFDIVTYTGTGANRTISHNLGSAPGCIIIKRTDTTSAWPVYFGVNSQHLFLNATVARVTGSTYWNTTAPTSSVFSLGTDFDVNANGGTYIAYLFASNAGGFGASGTDNVITCGIYNGTGVTGNNVTLNYEPQFVMIKRTSTGGTSPDWKMIDTMRGMPIGSDSVLLANSSSAEGTGTFVAPTATGFQLETTDVDYNEASQQYFYIAIRRGPMKTPTTGTSVFGLSSSLGNGFNTTVTGGQVADAILIKNSGAAVADLVSSRLTRTGYLVTSSTAAEVAAGFTILQTNPWDVMDGVKVGTTSTITNASGNTFINYFFRRAPGFFDVVCYTGTGVARTINHNLGVAPELYILKRRAGGVSDWFVNGSVLGSATDNYIYLNSNLTKNTVTNIWTTPTSTTFGFGTGAPTSAGFNATGSTYVAYLFATLPGVSKVGSYTGTGTTKQIDCGFTGGARFVLIKRTDSTGDWYLWDSARGIGVGNDPYWLVNTSAAEITSTDYINTYSAGFEIRSTAPTAINGIGGTFIFLAIA